MPSTCIVPSCKAASSKCDRSTIFHVLPNDPTMCDKWLKAIGLNETSDNLRKKVGSYRVCSDHFDDSSYHTKRTLLKTAVPTLKLRSNEFVPASDAQTQKKNEANPKQAFEVTKASNVVVIDEHTLRAEINRRAELEASMSVLEPSNSEEFLNYSREFLGPKTLKLIICQMLMKKYDRQKLPVKHKLFCLELYYHNPRAYRFLQQFMSLPPTTSLKNFYLNHSGCVSPRSLLILSFMVAQMNAKDKRCIVGIASTIVKKHVYYDILNDTFHGLHQVDNKQWRNPATKAYVLVVKGLLSTWQMPVAFALFHDSDVNALRIWADSIIRILMLKGLDICAFVSNQSDDGCKLLSELRNISSERNSFVVMKETIYNLFDVRYLVKSLRDTLMRYDISIASEGVATWEHIKTFYDTEVELQSNLAAGSTQSHINPDENQRTSTENADQLFSKTTAAAMMVFLRLKLLDKSAVATVNMINRVSDLVDSLNSDTLTHDSPYKKPFTGKKSLEKVLEEMYEYFKGLRRVSNGVLLYDNIEPTVGLMVTIKSMFELRKDLSDNGGFQLLTRSLNLEFVEDGIREIHAHDRKQKKKCDKITTIELMRGFNKYFLNCFIKNARLNSSNNLKSSLSKLHEYLAAKTEEKDQSPDLDAKTDALLLENLDHKISLPNQKVLRFLAGYLMTTAVEKHVCNKFINYLSPSQTTTKTFIDSEYLGVQLPIDFVLFVVKLEHEFTKAFQQDIMPQKVGASVLKAMNHLIFLPCRCFPLFLIKKLFIRIRIYNLVKDINRQLKKRDIFIINTYDL